MNPWKISTIVLATALGVISATGMLSVKSAAADPQPNMLAAQNLLKMAHDHLEKAPTNKGGHRERAMAKVDEASNEVRLGIDYSNTH